MPHKVRNGSSRRWRTLRARVLREEPTCWLQLPGCTTIANEVDHIVPVWLRPDLELVRANCRGACRSCNRRRGRGLTHNQPPETSKPPAAALAFFNTTKTR